jgi:hypothetical protein
MDRRREGCRVRSREAGRWRGDGRRCGAGSGPITIRMIAYRGVLLGLVGKMFQGSAPPDVKSDSKAASVVASSGLGVEGSWSR